MANTVSEPLSLVGRIAFGTNGDQIGPVQGVYLDRDDRHTEWAGVKLANGRFTVLPLQGAAIYEDSLEVPFSLGHVEDSPYQANRLPRRLSEEEEAELYRHYGRQGPPKEQGQALATTAKQRGQEVAETARQRGSTVAESVKQQSAQVTAQARSLVEDLQSFARRRPGAFLLGAALAGFAIGRLLKRGGEEEQQSNPPVLPVKTTTARNPRS